MTMIDDQQVITPDTSQEQPAEEQAPVTPEVETAEVAPSTATEVTPLVEPPPDWAEALLTRLSERQVQPEAPAPERPTPSLASISDDEIERVATQFGVDPNALKAVAALVTPRLQPIEQAVRQNTAPWSSDIQKTMATEKITGLTSDEVHAVIAEAGWDPVGYAGTSAAERAPYIKQAVFTALGRKVAAGQWTPPAKPSPISPVVPSNGQGAIRSQSRVTAHSAEIDGLVDQYMSSHPNAVAAGVLTREIAEADVRAAMEV